MYYYKRYLRQVRAKQELEKGSFVQVTADINADAGEKLTQPVEHGWQGVVTRCIEGKEDCSVFISELNREVPIPKKFLKSLVVGGK